LNHKNESCGSGDENSLMRGVFQNIEIDNERERERAKKVVGGKTK